MQYVAFCVWILALSITFSRFIHVVACDSTSFLFMAEYYSLNKYTTFYLSISWWTFGLFLLFAILNNTVLNIYVQVFCDMSSIFLEQKAVIRSGIGTPGWLSWLHVQLWNSAQVMIPGSWDGALHGAPC